MNLGVSDESIQSNRRHVSCQRLSGKQARALGFFQMGAVKVKRKALKSNCGLKQLMRWRRITKDIISRAGLYL